MRSRVYMPPWQLMDKASRMLAQDWRASMHMARLQVLKETFNIRHPLGRRAKAGKGDPLGLIGIRITDICNLRCHSCGQWGDNGYLRGSNLKDLKKREVPVEHYKRMVDEVADIGWK